MKYVLTNTINVKTDQPDFLFYKMTVEKMIYNSNLKTLIKVLKHNTWPKNYSHSYSF